MREIDMLAKKNEKKDTGCDYGLIPYIFFCITLRLHFII